MLNYIFWIFIKFCMYLYPIYVVLWFKSLYNILFKIQPFYKDLNPVIKKKYFAFTRPEFTDESKRNDLNWISTMVCGLTLGYIRFIGMILFCLVL